MNTYEDAGVSLARGDAASEDARKQLFRTFNNYSTLVKGLVVLRADFGGMGEPFLALASDGVGTKLEYAFASGIHNTVGIDLVAMCVNDLARNNIRPLGFALYRATGRVEPEIMHEVIEGVVEGCLQAGCVYTTGETAEMPSFYQAGEYDLAGFTVGVFDRNQLNTGERIREDDVLIGLASSGPHSNGYSLLRRVFPPEEAVKDPELLGELLAPTRIYVKSVLAANKSYDVHGWVHITGGGITGKLGKIIPEGLTARLNWGSWPVPAIFTKSQVAGNISDQEMQRVFNLGLGFIGVVSARITDYVVDILNKEGEKAYVVGEILRSNQSDKVTFV